jgi:hypothetical protein
VSESGKRVFVLSKQQDEIWVKTTEKNHLIFFKHTIRQNKALALLKNIRLKPVWARIYLDKAV